MKILFIGIFRFFIIVIIILLISFLISGGRYTDSSSLDDYIISVNQEEGKSSVNIDNPKYFLPDSSFIENYDYIEGGYYWRSLNTINIYFDSNYEPEIAILHLKYDKEIYYNAKNEMLDKIVPYNDNLYFYNDFVFYENSNYIDFCEERNFPKNFTMACYNDRLNTLVFIGFYHYEGSVTPSLEYLKDIDKNWKLFIDIFYGEYYDFNM